MQDKDRPENVNGAEVPGEENPAPALDSHEPEARPLYHVPEPTVWELLGERLGAEYRAVNGVKDQISGPCLAQTLGFRAYLEPLPGAPLLRGLSVVSDDGPVMIGNVELESDDITWTFGLMIAVHVIERVTTGACVVGGEGVYFANDELMIGYGVEPKENPLELMRITESISRLEDFCFGLFAPRDVVRGVYSDYGETQTKKRTPEHFSSQLEVPLAKMRQRFEQLGLGRAQ